MTYTPERQQPTNPKQYQKNFLRRHPGLPITAISLGGLITAGVMTGFFGQAGTPRSQERRIAVARAQFDTQYAHLSPIGKFALQYVTALEVPVNTHEHSKGLIGMGVIDHYVVGQTCLANSAYDVTPNDVNGNLIVGNIHGKSSVPAGGYLESKNQDKLVISSGNAGLPLLEFTGVNGAHLQPANQSTINELSTYGCAAGLPIHKEVQ